MSLICAESVSTVELRRTQERGHIIASFKSGGLGSIPPLMPPKKSAHNYDNTTRAQALSYKVAGLSNERIKELTGFNKATVNAFIRKAKKRSFDPTTNPPRILKKHVCNTPRSGQPLVVPNDDVRQKIIDQITTDRFGREKSCAYISKQIRVQFGIKVGKDTV